MQETKKHVRYLVGGVCYLITSALSIPIWTMDNTCSWLSVVSFSCFLVSGIVSLKKYFTMKQEQ